MNRCNSITKNNTRCRAKTKDNLLFCCDDHKPLNKEIIENGCFMCMEKIEKSNEIIFFKCKHAFHKPCYIEWLKFSTYDTPICIICRNITFNKPPQKIEKPKKYIINMERIENILNILEIKKIYGTLYNNPYIYSNTPDHLPSIDNYSNSPDYLPSIDNYSTTPDHPPPIDYYSTTPDHPPLIDY